MVINFAAETHVDRSIHGPQDFIVTNVVGTQTLLDACLRHQISRTVHIGTDEVYGSIDVGSWTEDEPLLPNSPYSAAKAAAEMLVRAYNVTYGQRFLYPLLHNTACPVPGEGHPTVRDQPHRRSESAAVWRQPERA